MNLTKLFEMQRTLDERIVKEKGLEGQDLLPQKILALQVELGECANEWRGFKYWSKDQQPRIKGEWKYSTGIENGKFIDIYENPLLEEYIDCLHFTLSIGNDIGINIAKLEAMLFVKKMPNVLDQLMWINKKISDLYEDHRDKGGIFPCHYYFHLLNSVLGLGEMLGFTWEQIEAAYMAKNAVNHKRQSTGY